jgi:hypothetical protein
MRLPSNGWAHSRTAGRRGKRRIVSFKKEDSEMLVEGSSGYLSYCG